MHCSQHERINRLSWEAPYLAPERAARVIIETGRVARRHNMRV
jgi:hypothetical protein